MQKAAGLEYEDQGSGEPLLLIHGAMVCGALGPLCSEPALASRYRLVRYHRRGFGGSDGHSGPFSIADQAADGMALLQHLGIERAHIVGHSYGGGIALQMALDFPAAVRSLVLIEPAILSALNSGGEAMLAAIRAVVGRIESGDAAGGVDRFMRGAEGPDWKKIDDVIPGAIAQAEADASTLGVEIEALAEWRLEGDALRRVTQPLLYMIGGKNVAYGQIAKGKLAELVPNVQEAVIPDAAHSMHHQKPAVVADAIHRFISTQ